MKVAACLALVALFAAPRVDACSCARQPADLVEGVRSAFNRADIVFVGVVEHVRLLDEHIEETTFYVLRSWKGERVSRVTTRIDVQCCLCGYSFEVGMRYLVYGYGRDTHGFVATSICSRTAPEPKAGDDIDALDAMVASGRGTAADQPTVAVPEIKGESCEAQRVDVRRGRLLLSQGPF